MSEVELRARLPNLIVIGAAKCGTSALHNYLAAHPEIGMSHHKEVMFFGSSWANEGGLPHYAAHFSGDRPVRGESSPIYTMFPFVPRVPEQMARWLEDPRFIYVVGEPVDRVAAHWAEQYIHGRERRSLAEVIDDMDDPANPYVCASRYGSQLERYLSFFTPDRILVIEQRELREARRETLRRAFGFAGVDPHFECAKFEMEHNAATTKIKLNRLGLQLGRTRAKGLAEGPLRRVLGTPFERPEIEPKRRRRLEDSLRPDIERFRELTRLTLADWSV